MIGCTICGDSVAVLHYHHTIPRSRGGEDSLQIPLCPTCHNSIHANAVRIVARIQNPKVKRPAKNFWTVIQEPVAQPYLQILVEALLKPIPTGMERQHKLTIDLPTPFFEKVKLLQLDLGISSQEKVLEFCIKHTLNTRGLGHESSKKPEMWFI